jgi:alanyl-tRNA synthetase
LPEHEARPETECINILAPLSGSPLVGKPLVGKHMFSESLNGSLTNCCRFNSFIDFDYAKQKICATEIDDVLYTMWEALSLSSTCMFRASDLRRAYLEFFVNKEHVEIGASSLVPSNDPTLMFTNSGMVQFKDIFTGKKVAPYKRATSSQKSLRAGGKHNDLDNVGYTTRHHTFFEMLGNFSFGDYFKEEAISWAFEFLTGVLGIDKEKLLVTVHDSDEEAATIWKKISGFSDRKIIRISTDANFWMMGDTGPCGPCSEIFYDHGESIPGDPPGGANEDGDRFVEIWNLVFTQFDMRSDGTKTLLESKCIDTGMGLERITAVMQGVPSNYNIDLFQNIIADIKHITNRDNQKYSAHYNVIADHMRAICFMIADGITPSPEGRGYVLRRIIRRALRHGYNMGVNEPFLYRLVPSIKGQMGDHYSELLHYESSIAEVLKAEENSFMNTIENGMSILNNELEKIGTTVEFPAAIAYKLYDTYGFPFDLTDDVLRTYRKTVDHNELNRIIEENKDRSKGAWTGTGDSFTAKVWYEAKDKLAGDTEFLRSTNEAEAEITMIIRGEELLGQAGVSEESTYIITDRSPFYAEAGGQIGDTGTIADSSGKLHIDVIDTRKIVDLHIHECIIRRGQIKVAQRVIMKVDAERRLNCSRNHTCTHMLQKALRMVLGEHVVQKGSLVTDKKLRFDFLHGHMIDKDQIKEIEDIVNNNIDMAHEVTTETMPLEDAMKTGAMCFFGEKYPEIVRVVSIGSDGWSMELCGGEHVSNTVQIKNFKIIGVSSIGSGIKRIEGVTGPFYAKTLEAEIEKLNAKIDTLKARIKTMEKEGVGAGASLLQSVELSEDLLPNGIVLAYIEFNDEKRKNILSIVDREKTLAARKFALIGNKNSTFDSISMTLFLNHLPNEDAVDILKRAINDENVRVGGRKDLAQSGSISCSSVPSFITRLRELAENCSS